MAFPTALNSQITDAVSQANVTVIGDAPSMALASLYQAGQNAIGLSMQNAVSIQQNAVSLANAVTSQCVSAILGINRPA